MADKALKKVLEVIRKVQGSPQADALESRLELSQTRAALKREREAKDEQAKALKKKTKAQITMVMVNAPIAAGVGYLVGDWAHDQVVERLGKDNVATPYVVPAVGGVLAYAGYSGSGLDLEERALVIGLGVGVGTAGLKRSYTDFWSQPKA